MLDATGTLSGYMHPAYAFALSEYGEPVNLPRSGGWVLERQIAGSTENDVMGCYPLFACQDWSSLHTDLERTSRGWVALSFVTDPFGDFSPDYLRKCFPEVMFPFKQHFIVDLSQSPQDFVVDHHTRNARKAGERVAIEVLPNPQEALADWISLYDVLVARHHIRGIAAFSTQSFSRQMQVPGLVVFRADADGQTVGMLLWYVMRGVAYYHLGAYNELGYELRASFALFWAAIRYFAENGISWLSLGAGAGLLESADDGLSRFKRGWSTGVRTAYFCGRVFDHPKYQELVRLNDKADESRYFPAYRQGEH